MPPDTTWSDQYTKTGIKLSSSGAEWKNFMEDCLIKTEIFKKSDLDFLNDGCHIMNQNIINKIDKRHEMIRDRDLLKEFPIPKEQIQTEARRFLREETHKKLKKLKEHKIITKEIERLRNILENYRKSTQKDLEEVTTEKVKHTTKPYNENVQRGGRYTRLWKRLESCEGYSEIDNWVSSSVNMTMETKINSEGTPLAVKVYVTKKKDDLKEIASQSESWNRKGSTETNENDSLQTNTWNDSEKNGKEEILKRYLETISRQGEAGKNKHTKISKIQINNYKREAIVKTSNTIENTQRINTHIEEYIRKRKLKRVWMAWRTYTIKLKQRKLIRTNYQSKIENFLTKLQDNHKVIKIQNVKEKKPGKQTKNNFPTTKDTIYRKQIEFMQNNEKREKAQKEILKEVISSQKETKERWLRIKTQQKQLFLNSMNKTGLGVEETKIPEFLLRMEKRREERNNRWKDIKERKKQQEEERNKYEKQKEEERVALEKLAKKKKLEEIIQKRKEEKEKKEREKQEREKLIVQLKLAEKNYERVLLKTYGWTPWKNLIQLRIQKEKNAYHFRDLKLKFKTFQNWRTNVKNELEMRMKQVETYAGRKLLRNYFWIWAGACDERTKQWQVAVDWDDLKIMEKAFKIWVKSTEEEQYRIIEKEKIADKNYEKSLKRRFLKQWSFYPELKRQEVAKEERKRIWRKKVQEILPDYRPLILFSIQEDLSDDFCLYQE